LACAIVSGGCRGSRYPSSTVTGRVTIDGAPVPKGYITFCPAANSQGPVVGARIVDGKYRCEKVPWGKVQVTFIAQAAEPMEIFDKANNTTHEVPRDILPPECRQGQTAEIISGANHLDFDLKSQ
jgi:hypothetical protein